MENIIKQLWSGEACEAGEMAGMLNDLVAEGSYDYIETAIKTSEGKLTKALTDAITKVNDDITAP